MSNGCKTQPLVTEKQWAINNLKILDDLYVNIGLNISLLSAFLGDEIEVRVWVAEWKRVRAQRRYEFIRKADGKIIAKGETQWIFVELTTGRPIQIPADMIALFPIPAEQTDSAASTP
ncbi:MAG: thioesterase family protein [Chloroflexota bacterium]